MQKINQQYIADRLKISRATVSRCFTNHPGINPETRSRVFKLAAQLGYVHMEMRVPERRSQKRSERVGVLICTDLDDYLDGRFESPGQKLMAGVSEYALLEDIRLDLHYVDPRGRSLDDPTYARIPQLRTRQWSGVLLIYPFPETVINALLLRFPVVSLVEHTGLMDLNCVDVDHYKGISMAVDRLLKAGHRRLGFFTRHYDVEAGWSYRRYSAFIEKLTRHGLRVDPRDLVNIPPNLHDKMEDSFDHVAERVRAGVTGWVCAADHLGYDLIAALQERGLPVPKRASVTGFNGIRAPKGAPRLSTAIVPYREIGLIGGKRLVDLVAKRFMPVQHVLVEAAFRDGETVANVWEEGGGSRKKHASGNGVHKIAKSF
jgi:DNA-binding LacI/PurR family transcriptional regulator